MINAPCKLQGALLSFARSCMLTLKPYYILNLDTSFIKSSAILKLLVAREVTS